MSRRSAPQRLGFAIRVVNPCGSEGYLLDESADVMVYESEDEARRELRKLKKISRYSWNCALEVVKFSGFGRA